MEKTKITIPVPHYLDGIGIAEEQKENFLSVKLKCPCGHEKFEVYKGTAETNAEELKAWDKKRKEYFDSFGENIYGYAFRSDENGFYETGLALVDNGKRQIHVGKLYYSGKPSSSAVNAIKIKCAKCGGEYVLFDNSRYGYDGMSCRGKEKNDRGEIKFKRVKRKISTDLIYEVKIKIENEPTFEDFKKASGESYTAEEYSEGFSWISVYISANGSTVKIYDEETA